MELPFKKTDILIPNNIDMNKWSVVACDQYTSEPDYWNRVRQLVGSNPSTLDLILPEVYLEAKDVNKRIKTINKNMEEMLKKDIFTEYKDTMIYLERILSNGKVREGLIGMIDLEDYSYEKGSKSLIRATEKTVLERIPPRVKVREKALLELPHIMLLIDDNKKQIIENLKKEVNENDKVYDFDLIQNGGHIKGYKLSDKSIEKVISKLQKLGNKNNVNDNVLLFAVGDGNHSLATAKTCYEKIKEKDPNYLNNPTRFALVELVNLHSDALEFEAINRVLFDIDVDNFIKELHKYYSINENGKGQKIELVYKDYDKVLYIENPKSNISVGSIQIFIDEYLKNYKGRIDYIHGEDKTKELGSKDNNVGIIFDAMDKNDLFRTVIIDGVLPRKTFSMGNSEDKRFYLEARKIK